MGYWTKVLKKVVLLVVSLIIIFLGFKLAIFYTPFLIGFIISLLIEPLVKYISKRSKMHRKTSAIIVLLIIFSILAALIIFGTIAIITEASNLLQSLNTYIEKIYDQVNYYINSINLNTVNIPKQVIGILETGANNFIELVGRWITSFLTGILQGITSLPIIAIYVVITILSTYFICTDKLYILDQLEHHFPKLWIKRFSMHLKEIAAALRKLPKSTD
jgi:predicted PurR-regulated permease PerM